MIRILGTKRVLALVFLLAFNVAFAVGVYVYFMPEKIKKDRELSGIRSKVVAMQKDIDRMQIEFEQLEAQQAQFLTLKKKGFFGRQGRRDAELVFQKIQKEAGVVSAVASVQSGTIEDNPEAQKAEHKILVSPVKISIKAVDDVDVFKYLYLLDKFFPGHITIEKVNMERKANVTGTVLRSIASGSNPELVSADIEAVWRTMIPQDQVLQSGGM